MIRIPIGAEEIVDSKLNILIVDDDIGIIDVLKSYLQDYKVEGFTSSKEAIDALKKEKFDLLILDYYVDDLNGDEIIKRIREFDNELYILLLTGFSESVPGMKSLEELDIQSYVEKKTEIEDVIIHIKSAAKSVEFLKESIQRQGVSFSSRLRGLRKKFSISQEELAQYLNVGRTAIANYESGLTMPSVEILDKLANYFGVSTDYLLCRVVDYPDLFNRNKRSNDKNN
ncbi:MAG: response regulator [Bacillota bacterium]